ncbi:MAG: acyltransferase, partial [Cytophagales bacterium]|nr:acyltransferase [Cytophagales bacterium]
MKKIIEKIIRLRNPGFGFDPDLNSGSVIQFLWIQMWNIIRALSMLVYLRNPKWAMFGSSVRMFNLSRIKWGRFLRLGHRVHLSALGKEGITLGNNVGIG